MTFPLPFSLPFPLHKGWTKTVLKLLIPDSERKRVTALGHALIWPLCAGFIAIPVLMWLKQQPKAAAMLGVELLTPDMIANATGGVKPPAPPRPTEPPRSPLRSLHLASGDDVVHAQDFLREPEVVTTFRFFHDVLS